MERLKDSKMYPLIKKCLVGLFWGLLVAFTLTICTSADNVSIVECNGSVEKYPSKLDGYGCDLYTKITIDLVIMPNDQTQSYNLAWATLPTSCGVFGSAINNKGTAPVGAYLDLGNGQFVYANLYTYYHETANGSIDRGGCRVSVRGSNIEWERITRVIEQTVTVTSTYTDAVIGDVPCQYVVNFKIIPNDALVSYTNGYTDGVSDTIDGGLSARQTAFGIITMPLNAVTRAIQDFTYGMFNNPIGAMIMAIGAIVIVVAVVFAVVKFVKG